MSTQLENKHNNLNRLRRIGSVIKNRRIALKMSQSTFVEGLSFSRMSLDRIEKGTLSANANQIIEICDRLGITEAELFGVSENINDAEYESIIEDFDKMIFREKYSEFPSIAKSLENFKDKNKNYIDYLSAIVFYDRTNQAERVVSIVDNYFLHKEIDLKSLEDIRLYLFKLRNEFLLKRPELQVKIDEKISMLNKFTEALINYPPNSNVKLQIIVCLAMIDLTRLFRMMDKSKLLIDQIENLIENSNSMEFLPDLYINKAGICLEYLKYEEALSLVNEARKDFIKFKFFEKVNYANYLEELIYLTQAMEDSAEVIEAEEYEKAVSELKKKYKI